ncbi:hypothetical protein Y032_0139g2105 [Ancylostoma ceylanicum]|nr:hypothetical protein Y032_0139g2105 [Ancylostoma ceylanicum]
MVTYRDHERLANFEPIYAKLANLTSALVGKAELKDSVHTWVREYYSKQAAARVRGLDAIGRSSLRYDNLYNALVPEVFCPDLVRVGNVLDGGKYVCNPRAMPQYCSIYSLGLREEISFDREIQEFNNFTCRLHGYDMTPQSAHVANQYKSINGEMRALTIGPKTDSSKNVYFLGDLVTSNNDTDVEFLKMDIEGAEHTSLIPFLQKFTACQIFLELHGKPIEHVILLQQIAQLNYALFSYEINGNSLTACEYSFIHLDCMEQYGASIFSCSFEVVSRSSFILRALFTCKASVDGGGLSVALKSTRRNPTAYDGIVVAVADRSFLDRCSSDPMLTNKKTK